MSTLIAMVIGASAGILATLAAIRIVWARVWRGDI
jgi:hypothetical protein